MISGYPEGFKKKSFPTTDKETKFDAETNQPTSISNILLRNYNFGLETVQVRKRYNDQCKQF